MVQLVLEFQLENKELPMEYDRLIVSFLKASIETYSKEMFEDLYNKQKSVIKPYVFALYLPGAEFKGDKICLNKREFKMFFSDADMEQTIAWFNAFQLMKSKKYPMNNNSMTLKAVRVKERNTITDAEIVVRMQSSLLVRQHNSLDNTDMYYTYDNPDFSQVLKENIDIFLQRMGLTISTQGFSITPVKAKKVVTNCFGRKVDGNIGIYKLCGSPELLNVLYQAGIGVRRSEGHGMMEVLC